RPFRAFDQVCLLEVIIEQTWAYCVWILRLELADIEWERDLAADRARRLFDGFLFRLGYERFRAPIRIVHRSIRGGGRGLSREDEHEHGKSDQQQENDRAAHTRSIVTFSRTTSSFGLSWRLRGTFTIFSTTS